MSWRKVKLGQLVDNFSVRAKDVGGAEGLDFFGVSNDEGIIKTKYAAEDKAEDYKIIEKDCFAYNPYRVNVGSIGLVAENTRGLISPAYVIFKPKPNSIKADLLLKFLKSSEGLRQIKFYARGTVRQALRFEDLCNIELSLPNFQEQETLINKLNNTETKSNVLSTELSHQQTLLKKLRQQLLQDAVQGKLLSPFSLGRGAGGEADKPASELLKKIKAEKEKLIAEKKLKKEKALPPITADEIPFDIPENWVWCRLGELALYSEAGKSYQAIEVAAHENQIGVIKTSAITSGFFVEDENKLLPNQHVNIEGIKIKKGDIIFCRASGSKGIAGKSCLVIHTPKANLILSDKSIRYVFSENVSRKYIQFYNSSFIGEAYYIKLGTTKSTSMNNITREQFNNIPIPLPPLFQQTQAKIALPFVFFFIQHTLQLFIGHRSTRRAPDS